LFSVTCFFLFARLFAPGSQKVFGKRKTGRP
jgi:hypothetical protein